MADATKAQLDELERLQKELEEKLQKKHREQLANGETVTELMTVKVKERDALKAKLKEAKRQVELQEMPKDSNFKCIVPAQSRPKPQREVVLVLSTEEVDRLRRALEVADRMYRSARDVNRRPISVSQECGEGPLTAYIEECCELQGVELPSA